MKSINYKLNLGPLIGSPTLLYFSLVLLVGMGWLDYILGYEIRTYPLYFIPLFLGSMGRGYKTIILLSILATGLWLFSNALVGLRFSSHWILVANSFTQFLSFLSVSVMSAILGRKFIQESITSQTDTLTGLLNRRSFFHLTEIELERSRRYHHPITLAYIDLDNFKHVNDTLGHAEGDAVLVNLSETIRKTLRSTDLSARLGGDEFALLLTETNRHGAEIFLERLRQALQIQTGKYQQLSISIGAVTTQATNLTVEELIHQSDNLMYDVKRAGKNAIRIMALDNPIEQ